MAQKPAPGIQVSIQKFDLSTAGNTEEEGKSFMKPLRLGSMTKPKPAKTPSPAKGPLQQGGGKSRRGRMKESIGALRPLDRWLLLGRKAEETSREDVEVAGELKLSEDSRVKGGGERVYQK